ncbi:single-stranded DNA-binding protein [Ruminococcus sp. CLA-AA-H200]|uniref:Single-stranded DNA-binding protein n=1 Tax=Ruminococcus turbiniformis TaxID=2881258 RepID=A0ABS8FZJ7_9FIRM|nr:single-stranded DNA-binding protein [Ruminococcus turbiniformis]MCC2255470.1 single-stranded DNA-binding protein [Ruminococcus turbiniformis]
MSDVNKLLEQAISEINFVEVGEIFLVKDLFKGYEWKRIPRSDRHLLGTLFLNYINAVSKVVVPIEKTSSNQQQYKKIVDRTGK